MGANNNILNPQNLAAIEKDGALAVGGMLVYKNDFLSKDDISKINSGMPVDKNGIEITFDSKKEMYGIGKPDEDRVLQEFREKEDIFRFGYERGQSPFEWSQLDLESFISAVFDRVDALDINEPFEEIQSYEYKVWLKQKKEGRKEIDYSRYRQWRYNPIIFFREDNVNRHKLLLKDDEETIAWLENRQFAIMPPATFVGRTNSNVNGRELFAIGIDLDGVGPKQLLGLFSNCQLKVPFTNHNVCPTPNIITNSGHGIHIYYLLAEPVDLVDQNTWQLMQRIKDNMTRLVWQVNTSTYDKKHIQLQPILQGFRLPGTLTKFGEKITSWYNSDSHLYSLSELNEFSSEDFRLTKEEIESISKYKYNPKRVTLAEAKNRWPEWYENKVVNKNRTGKTWNLSRKVYEWWGRKIIGADHNIVGHRFWCMMILFVYAKKCNVPFDEVMSDAKSLLPFLDDFTNDPTNHFTMDDIYAASKAYNEDYNKFPVKKIISLSGFEVKRNERKGRKQNLHLKLARASRDILTIEKGKKDWREGNGRPKATKANSKEAAIIAQWRKEHPLDNKSQCAKETGLSRPTVRKWWA